MSGSSAMALCTIGRDMSGEGRTVHGIVKLLLKRGSIPSVLSWEAVLCTYLLEHCFWTCRSVF